MGFAMVVNTIPRTFTGDSAAILRAIRNPDCNLAIWKRASPVGPDALHELNFEELRCTCSPRTLASEVARALSRSEHDQPAWATPLIEDASDLAEYFSAITGCEEIQLRLAVVETDSCRKFHGDWVSTRLITTYSGPGTEWIDQPDAARYADGDEPRAINRLETGDVGLFKGRLATDHPAIHRSPPIAGTGAKRLLLVLDPAGEAQ